LITFGGQHREKLDVNDYISPPYPITVATLPCDTQKS